MSILSGVPVVFNQYVDSVKFIKAMNLIVAKDRQAFDAVLEWANSPEQQRWRAGCDKLGNELVAELVKRFNEWNRSCGGNHAKTPRS